MLFAVTKSTRDKDFITAVLRFDRKPTKSKRQKYNKDFITGISAVESFVGKRSKGLKSNRSTDNILQYDEEEAAAADDDSASKPVEVTFEIRKKYNMEELTCFYVENEKRRIRRTRSNDSLTMARQLVVQRPTADAAQSPDKLQALPSGLSKSRDALDNYASSGDTESCSSSVLGSEQ